MDSGGRNQHQTKSDQTIFIAIQEARPWTASLVPTIFQRCEIPPKRILKFHVASQEIAVAPKI